MNDKLSENLTCENCKQNRDSFAKCVIVKNFFMKSCVNCYYWNQKYWCNLKKRKHSKQTKIRNWRKTAKFNDDFFMNLIESNANEDNKSSNRRSYNSSIITWSNAKSKIAVAATLNDLFRITDMKRGSIVRRRTTSITRKLRSTELVKKKSIDEKIDNDELKKISRKKQRRRNDANLRLLNWNEWASTNERNENRKKAMNMNELNASKMNMTSKTAISWKNTFFLSDKAENFEKIAKFHNMIKIFETLSKFFATKTMKIARKRKN